MIDLNNDLIDKSIVLTKVEDTKFDGHHPNGINPGYVKTGKASVNLVEGTPFLMLTENGYFRTSTIRKINDDMTFNTSNSVYKIELVGDNTPREEIVESVAKAPKKSEAEKSKRKPMPGRVYQHYKGGLYEVLHLAVLSTDDSDLVIYKSLHYGSYHARPLSEWFDVIKPAQSENPQPSGAAIERFMLL